MPALSPYWTLLGCLAIGFFLGAWFMIYGDRR